MTCAPDLIKLNVLLSEGTGNLGSNDYLTFFCRSVIIPACGFLRLLTGAEFGLPWDLIG